MKLAVMTYSAAIGGWEFTLDGIIDLCKFTREQGMDGIDWCSTHGADPREVRRIMDDFGLKTVCYTQGADLNFPEHTQRLPGLDKVKEILDTAAVLGSDKVMLPIGGKEGLSASESRRNCIDGLAEAVELAKGRDIALTIEHMHGRYSPFNTSATVNEAIEAVPDLRVTFDSGNCLTGGESSVDAFKNCANAVVHTHFKDWLVTTDSSDFSGSDGRYYSAVLIGEGIVDHEAVLREMLRHGYEGYIDIEYEARVYSPKDAVTRARDYLTNIMNKIAADR